MKPFSHTFYIERQRATLKMAAPTNDAIGAYRSGRIELDNGRVLSFLCRHSQAAAALTYLHPLEISDDWRRLLGLAQNIPCQTIDAPGAFILGTQRVRLLTQAIADIFQTPDLSTTLKNTLTEKMAIIPVLREGKQFSLSQNIKNTCGHACAEWPVEHIPDPQPNGDIYRLQSNTLTQAQRENIQLAVVGAGLTNDQSLLTLFNHLQTWFKNASHVELIVPHATLTGLATLLAHTSPRFQLRAHLFETPLNAQDNRANFFPHPEFHIRPTLAARYRAWWGRDPQGQFIANLPHIGQDGSDALFDPLRQIRTLNALLKKNHLVSLASVLNRHLNSHH